MKLIKLTNKISYILKFIGIVMICLGIVLWLYSLANTGGAWNSLNATLASYEIKPAFGDRFVFDRSYFTALSRSAGRKDVPQDERIEAIRPQFARWLDKLTDADAAREAETQRLAVEWLENEFDAAAFLDRFATMEDLQESQELREIFEYINSLMPAPKGKAAKLQAASQEPFFTEYYSSFAQEHGEAAGTWYEFMCTVRAMLEDTVADGETIRDFRTWMNDTFDQDVYFERLPEIQSAERAEMGENFATSLAALCEKKLNGESVDFDALLTRTADAVTAKYPGQNLSGSVAPKTLLCALLPSLMEDERFDGSYAAIGDAMRAADAGLKSTSADTAKTYLAGVLQEADKRGSISIIGAFWAVVARYLLIFVIGVLLVICAVVIKKIISHSLLNRTDDIDGDMKPDDGTRHEEGVLLRVEHLKQYFKGGGGVTRAVDDISFFIKRGEVFGLVGESGCGKTTTGRTIINLYDPTDGDVYFDGLRISSTLNGLPVLKAQLRQDYKALIEEAGARGDAKEVSRLKAELKDKLAKAGDHALKSAVEKGRCVRRYRQKRLKELKAAYDADMKSLTGTAAEERTRRYETEKAVAAKDNVMTRMQMIFQDPIASINPRMTVREIIAEGLIIRGVTDREYINQKVYEMLELVGLVREHADRYPHEFSGGQRQRIGIARAIIMEPELIIADEPISALDVSIQAQVINLLNDLRERMGLTIMFIAHNLSVVKYFSDRIAVMYFGKIVEMTTSDELFAHPLHPYTKSLLSAIPYPDPHYEKMRRRIEYNPVKAHDYSVDKPSLREITPGHYIHCNDAEFEQYRKELGL